ncbi:Quinolinate phosphoribosyl transferase [Aspergillus ambiguus]|uniref:nicotinate-nucleotide diphosphorylase (carboxylating) n=1 Tax=Aspergillus ambiguus TaxID=176160 RepID=UPI003CCCB90F
MATTYGSPRHLLPPTYKRLITTWLEEDCPSFDYGGFVVGDHPAEARLLAKSPGLLAGVPFFDEVFAQLHCTVTWHVSEGDVLTPGTSGSEKVIHCATVTGPTRSILLGERVALNILARCSGIASHANRLASALRAHGWHGTLAGTRKVTPGFRLVEKYAMLVGGADPHRHDLSAMTMLKDNHIWACANATGGAASIVAAIPRAVQAAKAAAGFAIKVEVECRSVEEANAAVEAGADVIMLDNFSAEGVRAAARELKQTWAGKNRAFLIEVSGGLNESNAAQYVCPDVDILSTSSIHQGTGIVDFSLKVSMR